TVGGGDEALAREEARERDARKSAAGVLEERAAIQQTAASVGERGIIHGMKRNSFALSSTRQSAGRPCRRARPVQTRASSSAGSRRKVSWKPRLICASRFPSPASRASRAANSSAC